MARYYTLAKGTKALPLAGGFPWPYEVSLCFDRVSDPVGFSEGVAHGAQGGHFSANEALQPSWHDHLVQAEGEWLRPFIERLASGQHLDAEEVLRVFRSKHGKEPDSYESGRT